MSKEEKEILIKRGKEFQILAERMLNEANYNLAVFFIEQSLQFYLKYILFNTLGYFPRTHSISRLFSELMRIDNEFKNFFDENEIIIKSIEDAYILSRYYPREYSKKEAEEMMKILLKFIDKFKKWIS